MSIDLRQRNAEYSRQWRKRHPDWAREVSTRWRLRNPERAKEIKRAYYERNRERLLAERRERYRANRQKELARAVVNNALRDGKLQRGPCEVGVGCRGRVEAHHEDYSEPLVIRWLCGHHHAELRP